MLYSCWLVFIDIARVMVVVFNFEFRMPVAKFFVMFEWFSQNSTLSKTSEIHWTVDE